MLNVRRIFGWVMAWAAAITAAHLALNVDWSSAMNEVRPRHQRKFNVAYIPVT